MGAFHVLSPSLVLLQSDAIGYVRYPASAAIAAIRRSTWAGETK